MPPKIVAIAGEVGAANALAPVVEMLRGSCLASVDSFACREAVSTWKQREVDFRRLDDDSSAQEVRSVLEHASPDLVLVGTGVEELDGAIHLEKRFVEVAREQKIPSLGLLDYWNNYVRRFYTPDGEPLYLPDRIALMDERARDEMIAAGISSDRLTITGQPHLESLSRTGIKFSPAVRQQIRSGFGITGDQLMVLFASQPIAELYGSGSAPDFPGYTEKEVLAGLIKELDEVALERHLNLVLLVRPHPRESLANYKDLKARQLRVIVSTEHDSHEIAMTADLVVGMATMLLVEACYLGCTVISLQPGLRTQDTLVTNQSGMSLPVYRWPDLKPAIQTSLDNLRLKRAARFTVEPHLSSTSAAQRVIDVALEMCRLRLVAN